MSKLSGAGRGGERKRRRACNLKIILGDTGAVSRVGRKGTTFVSPFLPTRLTAPGSPRMLQDAKCWLAEMTLLMTSVPSFTCFSMLFTFTLFSASRWLAEIWQLRQIFYRKQSLGIFNSYSSSQKAEWAIDSEAMRASGIIVLVKSD